MFEWVSLVIAAPGECPRIDFASQARPEGQKRWCHLIRTLEKSAKAPDPIQPNAPPDLP
jgi:hypothetical protein